MRVIYSFVMLSICLSAQESVLKDKSAPEEKNIEKVGVKRALKSNAMLKDLISPYNVNTVNAVLSEGIFYGRLRLNSFLFDWDEEVEDKRHDHYTMKAV